MTHTLVSLTASLRAGWLQLIALLIGSLDGLLLARLRQAGAEQVPLLLPLLALSMLPLAGNAIRLRRGPRSAALPDTRQLERLSALERWRCYQHQRRLVLASYQQQIARAVLWGRSDQALRLEEQRAAELRYLDGQCAARLRELHAGLAGARAAEWARFTVGEDGRLPTPPALVALANTPVGAVLPPVERLPLQGLAHQVAHDQRQGAWLRQAASVASSEPPTTAVLSPAMKRFAELVCVNAGLRCCQRCHSFGAAACARCLAEA